MRQGPIISTRRLGALLACLALAGCATTERADYVRHLSAVVPAEHDPPRRPAPAVRTAHVTDDR